jgi:hypothetical protein
MHYDPPAACQQAAGGSPPNQAMPEAQVKRFFQGRQLLWKNLLYRGGILQPQTSKRRKTEVLPWISNVS